MKIGIAGAGMIVRTCLETIAQSDGVVCTAIWIREQSNAKAEALAAEFHVSTVYTDYNKFLADENVDFIYIGIPNQLHFKFAKHALTAGKNVILEKPFTTSANEAETLIKLAEEKRLFLFEAITSLYMPMFKLLKQKLALLGDIKLIHANFSQYSSRYDRYLNGEITPSFQTECFGGAHYDLNDYNLHMLVNLFGIPKFAKYYANSGYNGVDTSGIAILVYDGFIAECTAAKDSDSPCHFTVQGTKGYARIVGKPNTCPALEIVIDGIPESFADPDAELRMLPELMTFREMWKSQDLASCTDYMRNSLNVMKTYDMMQET